MTQLEVDADAVAALGARLADVADGLRTLPAHVGLAEGIPPGATAAALDAVLGDWAHERAILADELTRLGALARAAGVAYLSAEDAATASFRGGEPGP